MTDAPDPTNVAVILVNWNGWRDTIDAVRGCLALERGMARLTIVVCDNGSTDGSMERISQWALGLEDRPVSRDWPLHIDAALRPGALVQMTSADQSSVFMPPSIASAPPLILIDTEANLGFAGGNNVGIRWALAQGCSHVWLLNNDAVPEPSALRLLLAACPAEDPVLAGSMLLDLCAPPRVQALAGVINLQSFTTRHLAVGLDAAAVTKAGLAALTDGHEMLYPIGASMLATRTFVAQVGLLSEDYFLYFEEPDWVMRAAAVSARVTIVPSSWVYHRHGASTGRSLRSMAIYYRSRILACARFAPSRRLAVSFDIAFNAAKAIARGRTVPIRAAWRALTGRVVVP